MFESWSHPCLAILAFLLHGLRPRFGPPVLSRW